MSTTTTIGPNIGMTHAEIARFDWFDLIDAMLRQDGPRLAWYRSISDQVARDTGQQTNHGGGYFVAGEVARAFRRRDLTTSVGSAGGELVATGIASFSSQMYSASVTLNMPSTRLEGLKTNTIVSVETVKGSSGWVAEGANFPDTQPTFGQIALTPKPVGGKVTFSRNLGLQMGPAAHQFVMGLLARQIGEAFDTGVLHGSGAASQPTGIASTTGIDSRAGTSFALADAAAMIKVAEGYGDAASIRAVAGVAAAETLRKKERAAGSGFLIEGNALLGVPLLVSRAVSANALFIAPWANVWIADWGALEIQVDPFSGFQTGKVTMLARWLVDVAVERASHIAYASAVS